MTQITLLTPLALNLVAAAALLVAALALIVGLLAVRRAGKLAAHYEALMTGVDGADLAAALEAYVGRQGAMVVRVDALERRAKVLDGRLHKAIGHVRLLRYSAFDDAGGDQSFALALLDDATDGVVLSGMYSRSGVRVYAKPVQNGLSPYAMTAEEERVIAEARAQPDVS